MRKQYRYRPSALRFRRWSRKGYAAFVSVQRNVTIGQLSANVSERLQSKNCSVHTSAASLHVSDGTKKERAEEEEDMLRNGSGPESVLAFLFLQTACLVRTANKPAAASCYAYNKKDIPGGGYSSDTSSVSGEYPPSVFTNMRLYD